jgi:hypothetical protein
MNSGSGRQTPRKSTMCEIMIWHVSFALNKGSSTVFKISKSTFKKLLFFKQGALDVKLDFQVSWRAAIP